VVRKRSRHVVGENLRTLLAADALRAGELEVFGKLMVESHASLRDDFEVSCAELDLAVEVALSEPGVFGARMTGGGFGGCTVSLVENAALTRVKAKIEAEFQASFGDKPELFATPACDGAREH
jgi:galactokinase